MPTIWSRSSQRMRLSSLLVENKSSVNTENGLSPGTLTDHRYFLNPASKTRTGCVNMGK
jgi:hypothetical protein